jgi:P-type E1-E2 ATPase
VFLNNGEERRKASRDIVVGDLVQLSSDDLVPCDMLILATSNEDGSCFVETAQLDGFVSISTALLFHNTLTGSLTL